jgi:hypothetical protein
MLFWAEVFNEGESSKNPINPKGTIRACVFIY